LTWYLYRVKDMDLVSVFCMQISNFPSNICWRGCLFSVVCFGCLCQKSGGHNCVDSHLDLLFSFIGLHVCFSTNTMLWLCSTVWSWVLWHLQCCSVC
jgi:hypothetical protein